jgi:hypothetical protein
MDVISLDTGIDFSNRWGGAVALLAKLKLQVATFFELVCRLDKGARVVDSDHFSASTGKFESGAPNGTAQIQGPRR